ncbi:MAG: hypothetical protein ACRCXK_13445 [Wohlfahrtiimonas sp.]
MEQNQLASQTAIIIQAADVTIYPIVGGVESKDGYLINSTDLSVTPATAEVQELKSTMRDNYGQTLDTYSGEVNAAQISLSFNRANPIIFAMAMGGTVEDIPANKGAVTDGEFIPSAVGSVVKLEFDYVESSTFKLKSDAETFVAGADFQLYPDDGKVVIISEKLAKAKDVKADYSYDIPAQVLMLLGSETSFSMRVEFNGLNVSGDRRVKGQIYRCTVTPTEALNLHGQEPVTATLTGKMITPAGKKAPFELRMEA